jgi:hypothetical protein
MSASSKQLDRALKQTGFGGIDDPNLAHQVGFCIRDHEHFRQVLTAVEPNNRVAAYETLRPYLRFEAKALDIYIAEAADLAGRKEQNQTPLEVVAEEAIRRNRLEQAGVGNLSLVCARCTKQGIFSGDRRWAAVNEAVAQGWMRKFRVRDGLGYSPQVGEVLCPECAKAANA